MKMADFMQQSLAVEGRMTEMVERILSLRFRKLKGEDVGGELDFFTMHGLNRLDIESLFDLLAMIETSKVLAEAIMTKTGDINAPGVKEALYIWTHLDRVLSFFEVLRRDAEVAGGMRVN